jgi:gamma-glutamyltranspeptidase / glutathione hydrolase
MRAAIGPSRRPYLAMCVVLGTAVLIAGPLTAAEPVYYQHGAVAADHPAASAVGVEILQRGGNVIDAALATAFSLSVVRPESSGLGGGGFLIYWNAATQTATAWDYRERAPRRATATMYVDAVQQGIRDPSQFGPLAIAVPGEIPGWIGIHQQAGKLPFREVIAPALRLATEGVPVDEVLISSTRQAEQRTSAESRTNPVLDPKIGAPLRRWYLRDGQPWRLGDVFHSPQQRALQSLVEHGYEAWEPGPIGASLLRHVQAAGGIWEAADLQAMAPVVRPVLRGQLGDYEYLTMPPPSSGGIALLQTLNILSAWADLHPGQTWKSLPEIDRLHLLAEALQHAMANRAEFLGDTDFVKVPTERLLSREYAREHQTTMAASRCPTTPGRRTSV